MTVQWPQRDIPELIEALRIRALALTGEKWERTATAEMMKEAADRLEESRAHAQALEASLAAESLRADAFHRGREMEKARADAAEQARDEWQTKYRVMEKGRKVAADALGVALGEKDAAEQANAALRKRLDDLDTDNQEVLSGDLDNLSDMLTRERRGREAAESETREWQATAEAAIERGNQLEVDLAAERAARAQFQRRWELLRARMQELESSPGEK